MKIHYIPINKFDMVKENFDGSISVKPHLKQRYIFTCENPHHTVYILNNKTGCLFSYNIEKCSLLQLNSHHTNLWINLTGLIWYNNAFLTYSNEKKNIQFFDAETFNLIKEYPFPSEINALLADDHILYTYNHENGTISTFLIQDDGFIAQKSFSVKGIGNVSMTIKDNHLFITDSEENIIRKYTTDGEMLWEALCPFIDPVGQLWQNDELYILYGGLVNEVGYDNNCWQEQKPFFHKIKIRTEQTENGITTFTNAFEVDFFYEEHFFNKIPSEKLPMTVDIAIPPNTNHQQLLDIVPLGHEFSIIEKNNLPFARFEINEKSVGLKAIGYKAKLRLQSIKTTIIQSKEFYLSAKDLLSDEEKTDFDITNPYFDKFLCDENLNSYTKLLNIRNTIFSKLYYRKNTYATSFIEVLKDGYGTCGDYTSLIMILLHNNNISCQSVGGYKVPRFYNGTSHIISAYYNHAWLEIYDKNGNSFPMETSTDDKEYNQRYSEGQFLGIDWTHVKLYTGKAHPNLIDIPSHKELHPFDYFQKANVYFIINKEMEDV